MTCPRTATDCYACELDAYTAGADHVDSADEDCPCGCGRVVVYAGSESCLGCERVLIAGKVKPEVKVAPVVAHPYEYALGAMR